jgi:signal transduction histidine kinase
MEGTAAPVAEAVARLSGLDLEDLLEELRARAGSVRVAQERMSALLDAVVVVSSDLELAAVLHRIVESACALVDATFGALGVLGPRGEELVEFVTHGVTDAQREAIGPLPHGKGLLGLIIRSPEPQRVERIQDHPDSYGFPPNHPVMTSFLGAPVRIRDQVFGNLYLTDKRGAPSFTEDDEAVLTALAAAAGVAIDNARLFHQAQSEQQWGEATRELVSALLQGQSETQALAAVAERVRALTGARGCLIALPTEGDLSVVATAGQTDREVGSVVTDPSWRTALASRDAGEEDGDKHVLVPLAIQGQAPVGLLVLQEIPQRLGAAYPLTDFGQRVAVGLTAAGAQRERARLDLLEDRDRIARDMHDHVIQRLFATGLSLQSASRLTRDAGLRDRLDEAVDEVDAVIKDIRHTIFALHRAPGPRSLTAELSAICDSATVTLGFAPTLSVQGSTSTIPEEVAADLLAVIREGLSNAARHAHGSVVSVRVDVGDEVVVLVTDDGRGLPEAPARSGLDNLARRATSRGGTFETGPADGGGTRLRCAVPFRHS